MNSQNVTLDLSKEDYTNQIVRIGQGDSSGTTIVASVYDNGVPVTLTGMTAKFKMRVPKVNGYVEDAHCNVSGNVITYVVDEEHCATEYGYTDEAYFEIVSGNVKYSTSRFRVKVERAASNGANPAQSYSDDIVSATTAARQAANDAREAMEEIGTAVEDAAQAAESAAQAVEDAQTAVEDADTAKREATSAANAATAAANNANSKANLANTAANNANTAANATNNATARAEAAIAAMGDISEQAVPVMSTDIRGGARIQHDSGLEITDTDNLQVRLALESDGTVRGGIAELTAKGHAEQDGTPTPDNPVPIQVVRGRNLLPNNATNMTHNGITFTVNSDGSVTCNGTASGNAYCRLVSGLTVSAGTYTISAGNAADTAGGVRIYNGESLDTLGAKTTTITEQKTWDFDLRVNSGVTVNNLIVYPQLVEGSTPQPYVPCGHVGMEVDRPSVSGHARFHPRPCSVTQNGVTVDVDKYGTFHVYGTASVSTSIKMPLPEPQTIGSGTYLHLRNDESISNVAFEYYKGGTRVDYWWLSGGVNRILNIGVDSGKNFDTVAVYVLQGTTIDLRFTPTEEGSSSAVPLTLYFVDITPIPLPSRGWVAGLPDGTADSLRLDGAGKCEWTLGNGEKTYDGSESWYPSGGGAHRVTQSVVQDARKNFNNGTLVGAYCDYFIEHTPNQNYAGSSVGFCVGTDGSFGFCLYGSGAMTVDAWKTWLQSHNVTVLYPLATPVTEDCGYCEDWPTDIPEGATLSIRELDSVGIKYFIDSSVTELAKQWYARAYAELGDAVTELAGRVAALES